MKQQIVLLFYVLLLSSLLASARLIDLPKQGEKEVKVNDNVFARSSADQLKDDMELMELVGSGECDDKDEECSSRRMIAEAHLDYIYTQHHKP